MITRIDATNYRCFERAGVPLGEFCVIAGANGSGKTTLLDVPILLGDILRSRNVAGAFTDRLLGRGARASSLIEVPFRAQRESFTLGIEARLPEAIAQLEANASGIEPGSPKSPTHARYELRLEIQDDDRLVVRNEYLFLFHYTDDYEAGRVPMQGQNALREDWRFIVDRDEDRESTVFSAITKYEPKLDRERRPSRRVEPEFVFTSRRTTIDRERPALARIAYESEAEFPAGRWFLDLLFDGVVFFDPKWNELRKASPPGLPKELMGTGENLPWLALALQKSNPERFGWWVAHVQTALPQIAAITVIEREEDHHAYFRVTYEGGFAVTSSGLSEGTMRVLALTLVAYLLNAPALLVIEEPENSIHPQAIATIMQSLRSLYDQQVWISTHSPVVLAEGKLEELVIARLERTGAATLVRGEDHPRLANWKGAIDLGSLFATGVFE